MTTTTADTPTHRRTIAELSITENEAYLDAIRVRRLKLAEYVEQAENAKRIVKSESTLKVLDHRLELASKAIAACDRAIERAESAINRVRVLVFEIEGTTQ